MQLALEPGVPGAIRKRQLVLPRCSARSHPACNPAAASSSSPAFCSNRSCSLLFNHSSQILTPRGGGEVGMGTRAVEAAIRTSKNMARRAFFHAAQSRCRGGTRKIIWPMQKHPLETDGVTDRNMSLPARARGLVAAFVRCEGRNVGVRDLKSWFALRLACGVR